MTKSLTDEQIKSLIDMPKTVRNPGAKWWEQKGARRRTFEVASNESTHVFRVYQRQNLTDPDAFSCGISLVAENGDELTLVRCNGPYHCHGTPIEGERLDYTCHVHLATARYIAGGMKPEHFAVLCDDFRDLSGATRYLVTLCAVANLPHDLEAAPSDLDRDLVNEES